jgi:hypothetical protein
MSLLIGNLVLRYPILHNLFSLLFPLWSVLLTFGIFSHLTLNRTFVPDMLIGLFIADFISGTVHMLIDKFKLAEEHHEKPGLMVFDPYYSRSGDQMVFGTIYFLFFKWLLPQSLNITIWTVFFASFAIEHHRWHHMHHNAPWIVRQLWKTRLFIDDQDHKIHHTMVTYHNKLQNYSILTGYSEFLTLTVEKLLDTYVLSRNN